MVNGAGPRMATMNIIRLNGGDPANSFDVGDNATTQAISVTANTLLYFFVYSFH